MPAVSTRRHARRPPAFAYTPQEAAILAGVSAKTVQKAIDEKIVDSRTRATVKGRARRWVSAEAVYALTIVRHAELELPKAKKRAIYDWLRDHTESEWRADFIPLSDVVRIQVSDFLTEYIDRVHSYNRAREKVIVRDPEIMGGTPVIRGTRITVYALAGRLEDGETIDDILEDYPRLKREDVEAAIMYAKANPMLGRPSGKPWRKAA